MTASDRALELTIAAARAAADKKAAQIVALDVSERLPLTDVFLICSGANERQVDAIVEAVDEAMHKAGVTHVRREGVSTSRWVLLDYTEIVVHVQHAEDREFYNLERLWRDCPPVTLPDDLADAADEAAASDPRA